MDSYDVHMDITTEVANKVRQAMNNKNQTISGLAKDAAIAYSTFHRCMNGAGTGSEVLSEQRDWNPKHVVRNILTETDKDAYNRALVRNAANKTRDRVQAETGLQFVSLTIYHDEACPEGAFDVGDELLVTGYLQDGHPVNQWVRVLTAKTPWGADETVIEVENV